MALLDIKVGDWVLVDHPFMRESYVVRRVASFTKSKFVGERLETDRWDGPAWRPDNARNRDKIKGVFGGENAAMSAQVAIKDLFTQLIADEKVVREKFHAAALALLDPA